MAIRLNRRTNAIQFTPGAQPILAFIDCDIAGGHEELAREQLIQRGTEYATQYSARGVAPLFVSALRERADLRMVCMVRNLGEFNNFMLDEVRNIEGVRETRTALSFGGWAEVDTLLELEMEMSASSLVTTTSFAPALAAGVWINVKPGMDRECFAALRDIPPHMDVRQVWLLHCHQSYDSDLNLLLLGKTPAALSAYVMSWIRTAPGVLSTELSTIQDWRWLAEADDLVELCGLFFQANQHMPTAAPGPHDAAPGSAPALPMPANTVSQHSQL